MNIAHLRFSCLKIKLCIFALIIFSAILCNSCSHTVSSVAVINTNTFQTAENLKAGEIKIRGSNSSVPSILSTTEIKNDDLDTFLIYTDFPVRSYIYCGTFQLGITDRLDIVLDAFTDFLPEQKAPGGKMYLKYQIGPKSSYYSFAVMPGLGISIGTKEKDHFNDDWAEIESGLTVLDFHFLMSRRYSSETIITFSPWIMRMNHEFSSNGQVGIIQWRKNNQSSTLYPGVSLGLQNNRILMESSFMLIEDRVFTSYGIALTF